MLVTRVKYTFLRLDIGEVQSGFNRYISKLSVYRIGPKWPCVTHQCIFNVVFVYCLCYIYIYMCWYKNTYVKWCIGGGGLQFKRKDDTALNIYIYVTLHTSACLGNQRGVCFMLCIAFGFWPSKILSFYPNIPVSFFDWGLFSIYCLALYIWLLWIYIVNVLQGEHNESVHIVKISVIRFDKC